MKDDNMRKHIYLKYPDTLKEALSYAEEFESVESSNLSTMSEPKVSDKLTCYFQLLDKLFQLLMEFSVHRHPSFYRRRFKCFNMGHIKAKYPDRKV